MVQQNWQGAWLSDLVRAHLKLFGAASRADVSGPALFLDATAVQNIGFALHELATNASKHGALHTPDGHVSVTWHRTDDRIHLEWKEAGGPEKTSPPAKGLVPSCSPTWSHSRCKVTQRWNLRPKAVAGHWTSPHRMCSLTNLTRIKPHI